MRDLLDSWQDDDTCRYCGVRISHNRSHVCPPDPPKPKPGFYVYLSGRLDMGPYDLKTAIRYAEAVGGYVREVK